jgi:hypothetical protein
MKKADASAMFPSLEALHLGGVSEHRPKHRRIKRVALLRAFYFVLVVGDVRWAELVFVFSP